ncbi:MAG: hypothetical protein ACPG4X_16860 [Pikeienuella sp.]
MTTIAAALDRVSRKVSVDTPDNWISTTDGEHVEIRDDFLPETVSEIQDRIDAPSPLSGSVALSTDGSETYSLPSDFLRLQRDAMSVYESTNTRRALMPVTDDGVWTHLKSVGSTGVTRYYRLSGYEGNWSISIYKEPTSPQTITVHYVSRNWMKSSGGTAGYEFTDVADVLMLPRRLVETGVVMRWRHRKGLPYDELLMDFEAQLGRFSNDRRARRSINFGDPYMDRRPWDVPVPDYIPES